MLSAAPLKAELKPSLSFSGVPGLIDMPSGDALDDGGFALSSSAFGPVTRATISFQMTPWLSGSFRLQNTRDWDRVVPDPNGYSSYNDRSFDLRMLLLREDEGWRPSLTLGLQDFLGTGLNSAEYLVASKHFGQRLKLTAGLGWGRLGSYGSIGSPLGERPPGFDPWTAYDGGEINAKSWFKGPASVFGGAEYQLNSRLTLKAEYSTDAYAHQAGLRQTFQRDSPFNFGLEYAFGSSARVGLYSLYGSEIGLSFQIIMDPKRRPVWTGILGPGPVPLKHRPARHSSPEAWDGGWTDQPDAGLLLRRNLARYLEADGIQIEDLAYTAERVQVRFRSPDTDAPAQAIGRLARALARVMPASVELFELEPVVRGVPVSRVTLSRSDLERLEFAPDSGRLLRERVRIGEPGPLLPGSLGADEALYPKFRWRLMPAVRVSAPARGDFGLRASASYDLAPGWTLSGTAYQRLADNFDKIYVVDKGGTLDPVRSDIRDYNRGASFAVERLTLAYYARPAPAFYSRVTLGYLERMHAGASAELLWKPADSALALGVEVNATRQRDIDGGFGFGYWRSPTGGGPAYFYEHEAISAHLSAYYDFGNGWLGQADVGRYLAGDNGVTLSLDREFANGWRVGAFASFTDASRAEFGEGAFDKGIRITLPMNWIFASPTRQEIRHTIRPLQRDGGARVEVEGRLYEQIRDYQQHRIDDQWERVWR